MKTAMETNPDNRNFPLFCALVRRLDRLQEERRKAWRAQDDDLHDKLAKRCFALIGALLNMDVEVKP
jgi:hypothetical protein